MNLPSPEPLVMLDDMKKHTHKKNKAAVALGRLGGLARAKKLSKEQLTEIGKKGGAGSAAKRARERERKE